MNSAGSGDTRTVTWVRFIRWVQHGKRGPQIYARRRQCEVWRPQELPVDKPKIVGRQNDPEVLVDAVSVA